MYRRIVPSLLACSLFLIANPYALAQSVSARDELLGLVPADAGFCLSLQNLRGATERWTRSAWIQGVRASALGQAIENAPEMRKLTHLESEMKKRFGITWASLRDDILGDAVVLAFWPALPENPGQEQGLLLVRARRADLLQQLVERLNAEQQKSKELKRLEQKEYNGVKYQLRVDQHTEHFVLVDGNVLAFAGKESLVRGIIDRRQGKLAEKNVIAERINRAGAERALAALWINPRAFDAELEQRAKEPAPDAHLLRTFLNYWKPLEAIVLSVSDVEDFEIKLSLQARTHDLPASVSKSFTQPSKQAELWNSFPEDSILAVAGEIDVARLTECIGDFLTPEHRKAVLESLRFGKGVIRLDLKKEVVPNIGPEWGMFVAPASNNSADVLTALAVKPGTGGTKVDRALLDGVTFFAQLAVVGNAERRLDIDRVWQDKVEVSFLTGPKVFPPGMRPAWALKDGYLIFASSPEAVLRFRPQRASSTASANGGVPVLMLSASELARLLRANREQVVDYLTEKNKGLQKDSANQTVENVLRAMDMIHNVTFLQSSGNGQLSWTLRVRPSAQTRGFK